MIGTYGARVMHLPTRRSGTVTKPLTGSLGMSCTLITFAEGVMEELPDAELRLSMPDDSSHAVHGVRFASNRAIPDATEIMMRNNGDGTVTVEGAVPGGPRVSLRLPIEDGQIVLPDDAFFPVGR